MLRRTTFLAVLLTGGTAAAAPALNVESGRTKARASAGVTCIQIAEEDGTPRGECSGRPYPLKTKGSITLQRGGKVQLRFAKAPGSVKWRLLRKGEASPKTLLSGDANRAPSDRKRFVIKLPRRIPCGRVIDIYGVYGQGASRSDQVWWVAVRSPGCKER